jgi:predicted ATPase/DNA-binding SARP family transcriptional activator
VRSGNFHYDHANIGEFTMAQLKLLILGQPRLERDEAPIELNLRKALALLVYLAVSRQPHSRDALAAMLWPESDGREARARLRRTLHRLHQAIGDNILDSGAEAIRLDPAVEIWLDSAAFRQHATAGLSAAPQDAVAPERLAHLNAAVALYTEDFLEGFTLPDSPAFDEWQFFQRESLRQLYGQVLEQLVQAYQSTGTYGDAIKNARRWVALDALHEAAHRTLMRLYAFAGQPAAATRQYQECVRVLEAELDAEPEQETTALYELIRTRQLTPPGAERTPPIYSAMPQPLAEAGVAHMASLPVHNLPLYLTSFIGRDAEIDTITRLLSEDPPQRLLTLVGPGGVGKTRLALAAAERQVRRGSAFPDGIFFVALAPVATAAGLVPAVANAVRFAFSTDQPPHQQLLEYLRPKRLLLVLDNLEHLLDQEALELIGFMFMAPGITLLITSRARLNVQGEAIFSVGGLPIAPIIGLEVNAPSRVHTDGASSALDLFVQRARRVQPDFILAPALLPAVTRICELVQGLPLGIELAAAWADMLGPAEIAAEIERSLDFLAADWRDVPERQQSLRAVFDASWVRLDAATQGILQALTVFHAPFERQAAQAVAGTTIQTLRVLVNESWLQRDTADRFSLHELMRQYVAEILARDPSAWRCYRDRHAAHFGELLHQLDGQMRGPQPQAAVGTLRTIFDDVRAAWLWLVEQGDFEALTRQMLPALFRYAELDVKGFAVLPLLEAAQRAVERNTTSRDHELYLMMLLAAQGAFLHNGYPLRADLMPMPGAGGAEFAGDIERAWSMACGRSSWEALGFWGVLLSAEYAWTAPDAHAGLQQLRDLISELRPAGRRWDVAFVLQSLGQILSLRLPDINPSQSLDETLGYLREALMLFEALGDARESGNTLRVLGGVYLMQQRLPEAQSHFEAARQRLAAIDDWGHAVNIHWQLADVNFQLGEMPAAFHHLRQMSDAHRQRGHLEEALIALSRESYEALRYSDLAHARMTREDSLSLARQVGDRSNEAWNIWEQGEIERVAGNYTAARQHYEQAYVLFADIRDPAKSGALTMGMIFYQRGLGDIAYACDDPAASARHFQASLGLASEIGYDWPAAYALAGLARAALARQQPNEAREYLYKALAKAQKYGADGVTMVVLTGIAEMYAATGAPEQAHPLASLVIAHPISWNETKARARRIQAATAEHLRSSAALMAQPDPGDLWPVVAQLQERLAPREL